MTIAGQDLNPPMPFLFPGVGEQASQSWPRARRIRALSKTGQLGAVPFPFRRDRAAFFQILSVRKQEHEHGVIF
jgi:hypothetical protein